MQLDSVQIGVAELDSAARAYEQLLGVPPIRWADGARRFQLSPGAVELEPGDPGLHSLRFTDARDGDRLAASGDSFNGLLVRCDPAAPPSDFPAGAAAAVAIDHVVIHSPNVDRAIALWRDRLHLRLALDREFPARGLRIVFFRSGGITLEFVSVARDLGLAEQSGPDRLYGIAYRVPDLHAWRNRLLDAGVDVTPIRAGHKPGTSVATVHTGTADVPTLLIEDRSRRS